MDFDEKQKELERKRAESLAMRDMINMLTDALGIIDDDEAPNKVKAVALYLKIDTHLQRIQERATDDDVTMLKQLYEALEEREKNND